MICNGTEERKIREFQVNNDSLCLQVIHSLVSFHRFPSDYIFLLCVLIFLSLHLPPSCGSVA